MTATPAAGYFGATIPAASSVPLGRFVPWDFHLASSTVTPACGGTSYMSQPFGVRNDSAGARNRRVTKNYRGAFCQGTLSCWPPTIQDRVDRSNRLDPGDQLVAGVADFTSQEPLYAAARAHRAGPRRRSHCGGCGWGSGGGW